MNRKDWDYSCCVIAPISCMSWDWPFENNQKRTHTSSKTPTAKVEFHLQVSNSCTKLINFKCFSIQNLRRSLRHWLFLSEDYIPIFFRATNLANIFQSKRISPIKSARRRIVVLFFDLKPRWDLRSVGPMHWTGYFCRSVFFTISLLICRRLMRIHSNHFPSDFHELCTTMTLGWH